MKYLLLTGGSCGIGYELARIFASNQFGIIIVSNCKCHASFEYFKSYVYVGYGKKCFRLLRFKRD